MTSPSSAVATLSPNDHFHFRMITITCLPSHHHSIHFHTVKSTLDRLSPIHDCLCQGLLNDLVLGSEFIVVLQDIFVLGPSLGGVLGGCDVRIMLSGLFGFEILGLGLTSS